MTRTLCVILDWNQPGIAVRAAAAAASQDVPGHDVLMIDNGSSPANAVALRDGLPPGCRLLRLDRNLGFAGGMNVGIRHALDGGYDFVWLLNNDAFPEPDCLRHLLAAADPALACLSPAMTFPDGRPQTVGYRLELDPVKHVPLTPDELAGPVGRGHWLVGAALLCRSAALARSGGFDDRYFAYWEEVDLQHRLAELGYALRVVPDAKCVHLGSVSTGGLSSPFAEYMIARNAWLYVRKHAGRRGWDRRAALMRLLADQLERAGGLAQRGRPAAGRAVLAGAAAGAAGRAGRPGRMRAGSAAGRALIAYPGVAIRVLRRAAGWLAPAAGATP
jgi:GT2 family glycosyltransferase